MDKNPSGSMTKIDPKPIAHYTSSLEPDSWLCVPTDTKEESLGQPEAPSHLKLVNIVDYENVSTFFSNNISFPERRNKRKSVLKITKMYYFFI